VAQRDNVTYSAYKQWYDSIEKVDTPAELIGGMSAFIARLDYPRALRSRLAKGTVRVKVSLDAAGRLKAARVIQSGGADFDAIVLRAILGVQWRPAIRAGKPVPFTFTFPVSFNRPRF
jgi:TonB family protein